MMHLKDKKIEILEARTYTDKWGNRKTEKVILTTVWAYMRYLSGEEIFQAAQTNAEERVLFRIRWREGLDPKVHSIRYKTEEYDITRIDTFEGYKTDIVLYAKKRD